MKAREDDALTEDDIRVPTDEEQAEIQAALGPRRTAQVPLGAKGKTEDDMKLERFLAAREKRNQVPKGYRGKIKVKRNMKRNLRKASRKSNRGS
jgi:hypothetical protein